MEYYFFYIGLILFGLCMGSFAGASVWRLRAVQLQQDKDNGDEIDKDEYKRLKKIVNKSLPKDRSCCLYCSYELKWYDLIPMVSWVSLGGRCRKCHKKIGYMEPLIEVGVATYFIASYLLWPYPLNNWLEVSHLIIWLLAGVGLAILFFYDAKWFLLPDKINFMVIFAGFINVILVLLLSQDVVSPIFSVLGAILILSGIYLALYLISNGRWIGFGDIKLGLGLALLLADWRLAFVALFAANLIGCILVIPGMLIGKLKRDSHIPFGPLLILGFVIAQLFGQYIIDFYLLGPL